MILKQDQFSFSWTMALTLLLIHLCPMLSPFSSTTVFIMVFTCAKIKQESYWGVCYQWRGPGSEKNVHWLTSALSRWYRMYNQFWRRLHSICRFLYQSASFKSPAPGCAAKLDLAYGLVVGVPIGSDTYIKKFLTSKLAGITVEKSNLCLLYNCLRNKINHLLHLLWKTILKVSLHLTRGYRLDSVESMMGHGLDNLRIVCHTAFLSSTSSVFPTICLISHNHSFHVESNHRNSTRC